MSRAKSPSRPPAAAASPVTPDGRYLVVRGRLWRRADPALDEVRRQALVTALMRARRALREVAALPARRRARTAVDRAKRALGERGAVWWRDGSPDYNRYLVKNTPYVDWYQQLGSRPPDARVIGAAIRRVLKARGAAASACPSEIARQLAPGSPAAWRALMPRVRHVAQRLAERGTLRLTRGAQTLAPGRLGHGPIRIRRGSRF